MIIPMIIDDDVRANVERVKKYAAEHVVSLVEMKAVMDGEGNPVGDTDEHTVVVPSAFRVVFSLEEQPHGICRHLSMSVAVKDRMPHPVAVQQVCELFGFVNNLDENVVWTEKIGEGGLEAVNVLEPLDGDWSKFQKAEKVEKS